MLYRETMTPAIIGMALIFTFTTVSASELDKSAEDQAIIVAQNVQHGGHEKCNNQHSEKKACQHKKGMNKSSGGMMGHMSGRSKHRGGHSYAHMIATHAEELELSDAQLGRIVRLHMQHSQEHKQFKKKIRKSMMHFHHAGMKPGTDDATLRKLGNDHVVAFKAMLEQHIRSRNVVHAILTAEQREQLKTMQMNHGMHGGGHKNHGKPNSKHSKRYY
jgi:hypothetical protein